MRTQQISSEDLRGVFAVPPLPRKSDRTRSIHLEECDRLIRHLSKGGISRFMYGGNAFLYHITLTDYEILLDWLTGLSDRCWVIPSAGPSFGRAIDQARLLRRHRFPAVMLLPCGDPRDASGLENGWKEFAAEAETKLILYLKDEGNLGANKEAGLDALGRLVNEGLCVGIKYAVVRADPSKDAYLEALLQRVDRRLVISGIGERPAISHLRDWKLPGFTTGSGCIAPRLSTQIFQACARGDFAQAEAIRSRFLALEDLRDAWNPAKVLHCATELAAIAATGALIPYLSPLSSQQMQKLAPVAKTLGDIDASTS